MTAYVTIPVATVQNVLKLPNTALRYKPPMTTEEILAIYQQYGIEGGQQRQAADDPAAGLLPQSGQTPTRAPKKVMAVVWKRHADNAMEPVKVSLGITDHAYTEITAVLQGQLKEGDEVIIRSITPNTPAPGGLRR